MVPRVVDTAFLQHPPNPRPYSLSAFYQKLPRRRKDATTVEAGAAKFEVAQNGKVTIYLNVNGNTDNGDGYKITLLGKEVTVYNKNGEIAKDADPTGFEVKVGGDTLVKALDSILGTAKFTFNKFENQPAGGAQIATFDGALKDASPTITLEESADGDTWIDNLAHNTMTVVAGTVSMRGTAADVKANKYYRLKISEAGYATAYVNMTGKTAAAKLSTTATIADGAKLTCAFTGVKDQFGDDFDTTGISGTVTMNGLTGTITNGGAAHTITITFAGTYTAAVDDNATMKSTQIGTTEISVKVTAAKGLSVGDTATDGDWDAVVLEATNAN